MPARAFVGCFPVANAGQQLYACKNQSSYTEAEKRTCSSAFFMERQRREAIRGLSLTTQNSGKGINDHEKNWELI